MDVKSLKADDILAISLDRPERLFTVADFTNEIRALNMLWHPDRCKHPDATIVFQRIKYLEKEAESRMANNTWDGPAKLNIKSTDGKSEFNFKYRRVMTIDIGKMYVGTEYLAYVVDPANEDLFRNGIKMIESIKYPAEKFEKQFKRQMPNIVKVINAEIGFVVVMKKTAELVLLKDLLDYLPNNKMDPKHMAWIMSTLCNMACFLQMNNIAHCAITPSNIWISPEHHSGVLLGGWWYARPNGEKLLALPSETISILPSTLFADKKAKTSYDGMLIKAIGLECVGDPSHTGSRLLTDKSIPATVLNWLRSPSANDAVAEYRNWGKARDDGFGARKFVELVVDVNKIY